MVQFSPQQGVYVYARQYQGKTVLVMVNGTDNEVNLPLKYYREILEGVEQGKDIITNRIVILGRKLKMTARESLILEL